ncbi:hypothetical protein WJX74_008335 [Apatococcus lobatus]|uniref:Activator of basal transcription 1 n=2 Tax=Apatococcus TaxID=904362 RepID=A0AAW1S8U3_9CHLO
MAPSSEPCIDRAGPSEQMQEQQQQPDMRKPEGNSPAEPLPSQFASDAGQKRGIVYLSRIPPGMKPQKVRQLLSIHGEIGRLYLAPEGASSRKKRSRNQSGAKAKSFTEGWVEFENKRVAKQVAAGLNGQQMGGKRRSRHHFDLWSLKYLPKFKWEHLTEEIAYQRAIREQKLATEVAAANKERDFYLSRVDRAKALEAQQARKRKRLGVEAEPESTASAANAQSQSEMPKPTGPASMPSSLPADVLALIAGHT